MVLMVTMIIVVLAMIGYDRVDGGGVVDNCYGWNGGGMGKSEKASGGAPYSNID